MRTTYRVDVRRPPTDAVPRPDWEPATRKKTRREADFAADAYANSGFETRVVVET